MSEREPQPHKEPFSDELETDLYGLIGDMEEDLSQADCAVGEADLGLTLEYLQSVLLEVNRGIYLLYQESRRRAKKDIDEHSIERDGIRYYVPYMKPSDSKQGGTPPDNQST